MGIEEQSSNRRSGFVITKNTKYVSDSGKDENRKVEIPKSFGQKFRLLDDDDQIYFYGWMYNGEKDFDEFRPLDEYGEAYGCTSLQYKNKEGEWKCL